MAEEITRHPGGRPTKYKDEFNEQAYKLCLLGATDIDLAKFFEVEEQTVNNWKIDHPKFFESIKAGKEEADAVIASKLFHRASGYSHPEDKIFVSDGEPIIVPTVKHYPPDTAAAIFWLKNRRSDLWRDKIETEISGPNGGPIEITAVNSLSEDDLRQMEQILAKSQALLPE